MVNSLNLEVQNLMDIPSLVSKGVADLGIVGQNVLEEQKATNRIITAQQILELGFSNCKLAFAKPLNSRLRSLKNKRIATSYPALVKKYLKKNSIDAEVIKINGSVELTPYIGIADCICDLVSSGATLDANNLIEFKSLMKSQAVLISPVELNKIKQKNIINIIKRFEGVINAADSKYIMLNVDSSAAKNICNLLPGADSPTIIPLQKDNKVAIHALCKEPVFWETIEKLKLNGASSILVLPVEKILN